MALSALTVMFNQEERPRAVGIWSAANFVALPAGPILGGWLLAHYWWGWVFLINVPVAVLGLAAGLALVPESRSNDRPGLDPAGLATAAAGLVLLTYGTVEAGSSGWIHPVPLACIGGGLVLLAGFTALERRLAHRPDGQPLIDPGLFRSRSYTAGVVLAAVGVLAMIGVLFLMPQYFQAIQGADPVGSGLRLMPVIGGLIVGALPADRVAARLGPRAVIAGGFVVLAAGLGLGALTTVTSSTAFVAGWMALTGLGLGLVMATATSAALSELDAERSGMGSAVLQAVNKTGAPFGAAVLGSVLMSGYRAGIDLHGVPAGAADTVRSGVFGGVAIARKLSSPQLLESVRSAFTSGLEASLWIAAAIALAGAVAAVLAVPRSGARRRAPYSDGDRAPV